MSQTSEPTNPPARGLLKAALARLLQVDLPVPQRSEAELAAEVDRNHTWNFTTNLLDAVMFWLGRSFISPVTVLPLFLNRLTTAPLAFGLLAVISQSGWFLPQLFTANTVERLARKKPVVVRLGLLVERFPAWTLVLAGLLAGRSAPLAMGLILVGYGLHVLGGGLVATSWQDLIARCFPVERRGRFMGTASFAGSLAGALGSILTAWLLSRFAFPTNFTLIFVIGAGAIALGWIPMSLVREPVKATTSPRLGVREYAAGLPALLRQDHNFRRFLITRVTMALAAMANGFVAVSAASRWQVPDSAAGAYTLALLGGQTAGNLLFGFLADRRGHKVCMELGSLAGAAAFGLAWLAPGPAWYHAVFVLQGLWLSSMIVSGLLIAMEFSDPARRPTYMGITNTAAGLAGVVAPLVGAGLASASYALLFAVAMGLNAAAFILFRWWVREPRSLAAQAAPAP